MGRGLEAEEPEGGRRDVDERRVLAVDPGVAEEDTRNASGIDAMVSAPRLHVVLEDGPGHHAGRAVPRDAVALGVADQKIGGMLQIRSVVEGRRVEGLPDRQLPVLFVPQPR
jgi:hypothetical protein